MRQKVVISGLLLVAAFALTEVHSIVYAVAPHLGELEVSPFIQPGFEMKVNLMWMIKMVADDFLKIVLMFVMAKTAKEYSYTLFLVSVIFFVYCFIDLFLLFWNYKQTYAVYWFLLLSSVGALFFTLMPEKKTGTYKSMI